MRRGLAAAIDVGREVGDERRIELAAGDPETLSALVDKALHDLPGSLHIDHSEAFRPSPPVPEHRFQEVI